MPDAVQHGDSISASVNQGELWRRFTNMIAAGSSVALQKFAKTGTNLQIATLFVHIVTAEMLQKRQLHYSTKVDKLRKTITRCE